jgi:stage III sporulation protein AH
MKTQSTALCEVKRTDKFKAIIVKIGKRNLIIAAAVLVIAVSVLLNFILFSGSDKDGYDGYEQPSGNVSDNLTPNDTQTNTENTYFSATQVSRQRARDEALEVLQAVVDSADSSEVAKNGALESIAAIANEIQKEANIESLITAKGFEQCIAIINDGMCTVVVMTDGLLASHKSQINEIVYEQTGIKPVNVKYIQKG